jgi:regulator of sigma D
MMQNPVLTRLVKQRNTLLNRLVKLNSTLRNGHDDLAEVLRTRFCDSLVDYLSEGHLRAFQSLPKDVRQHDLAAIDATTRAAMGFNTRFGGEQYPMGMAAALETLVLVLETRFELEDKLFASSATIAA